MTERDMAVLSRNRWFATIPAGRQALLFEAAKVREVEPGTRIYREGDPPNGLFAVLDGEIRLVGYPEPGIELVAMIVKPGRWFGELSMIDGGVRPHDAVATRTARIAQISVGAFGRAAAVAPLLWRDIAVLACTHQRVALQDIGRARNGSSSRRLAQVLGEAIAQPASDHVVRIRQDELAAIVGVSRQRLNRLLQQLVQAGLVETRYASIRVLDPAGVAKLRAE